VSSLFVSDIVIYPVKSCAPLSVDRAWVDYKGLNADRRYMLVDKDGLFITARKYPKLTRLLATPTEMGLVLSAVDKESLTLVRDQFSEMYVEVKVWGQVVSAQKCSDEADQWLSEFLQIDCQLVYFGELTRRPVKDVETSEVSFADGYPLLLATEASHQWLQERCPAPFDIHQFRPNLVITGNLPFAEDQWLHVKIGEAEFAVHSPCERCKLITLPVGSESFNSLQEPLRTLSQHRRLESGGAIFGQNLVVIKSGLITKGVEVEVLSYKAAPELKTPSAPRS